MDEQGSGCPADVTDLLSTALAHAGAVVSLCDSDGICRWVSDSVIAVWGLRPTDLVGRVWPLSGPVATGSALTPTTTFVLTAADGSQRHVRAAVTRRPGGTGHVVAMDDVTDLRDLEQRLAGILESGLEPHVHLQPVVDEQGVIVDFRIGEVNTAAREFLSTGQEPVEGASLLGLLVSDAGHQMIGRYRDVMLTGVPLVLDDQAFPSRSATGEYRFDIRAVKVGEGLSLNWRDVTPRYRAAQELAASEAHFREIAESLGDVVRTFDLQGLHTWVSPSVTRLLGYDPEDLIGRPATDLMHPDDIATALEIGTRAILSGSDVTEPRRTRLRHADGRWVWTETTNSFRRGAAGEVVAVYAVSRDADAKVRAEQELQRLAQTDPLTGLLNRSSILARLEDIVAAEPEGSAVAVFFCDIDNLKVINDTVGHAVGDRVIAAVAAQTVERMGQEALVARFGGDEILAVSTAVRDLDHAVSIADALLTDCRRAGDPGHPPTGVSIGVTLIRAGDTVDGVIARADRAMYEAKAGGRGAVVAIA